ncbi:SEC14 cytosolic factor family protein [Musa troglodytarum]|uniref:SEC14 cytosolic factor family protein n=1 Tax=Musa troglodytarum TaxID=320322 RepID=A0A9E7EBE3_9LILI|nr:SEC14 cytosolic factor family protein [Musa troglodytarum]
MGMERKQLDDRERVEAVLEILKKQAPLTVKQEKFCNDACVERFLRGRGDSLKKAAKQLRATLSWRESIGIDHLIADEFAAELAGGLAYVAGHDDEARPVMVFRIKQDYAKTHSQKSFVRFLVFTLEVAISSKSRFVDQFVILFDASMFDVYAMALSVASPVKKSPLLETAAAAEAENSVADQYLDHCIRILPPFLTYSLHDLASA